ncbi:MAG TPA: AMP-binding protein, partial [Hyphomicrobiaceae bacterium]|nr:AMP-binding protein [Hyphomicrobiaceae bacterium]
MADLHDHETLDAVWQRAVVEHRDRPFLCVPASASRDYATGGLELTYAAAAAEVDRLTEAYRAAGYGLGHRVALLLDNRPEHVLHRLALSRIGTSCVPINPDYRPAEIAYLVEHSEPELVLALAAREEQVGAGLVMSSHKPHLRLLEAGAPPPPRSQARPGEVTAATEGQILYTSGTTGRPKGCILSQGYEVASGAWYASLPGMARLGRARERIYNPLPLYHVNAGVVSLIGAIVGGNCQILPDRFHPERWWPEVSATRASVIHYLGVVIQMLMKRA